MSRFKIDQIVNVKGIFCKIIEVDEVNNDYLCWPVNKSEWVDGQTEFKGVGSWVYEKNISEVQS